MGSSSSHCNGSGSGRTTTALQRGQMAWRAAATTALMLAAALLEGAARAVEAARAVRVALAVIAAGVSVGSDRTWPGMRARWTDSKRCSLPRWLRTTRRAWSTVSGGHRRFAIRWSSRLRRRPATPLARRCTPWMRRAVKATSSGCTGSCCARRPPTRWPRRPWVASPRSVDHAHHTARRRLLYEHLAGRACSHAAGGSTSASRAAATAPIEFPHRASVLPLTARTTQRLRSRAQPQRAPGRRTYCH